MEIIDFLMSSPKDTSAPIWVWGVLLLPALWVYFSRKAENERVARLDREHQQMRRDIQSGRW